MYEFTIGGKSVSVFPSAEPDAPVIYLNTYSDEGQQVFQAAQAVGCPPLTLVAISDLDWNHDMAPWDSPEAFKGGEPFTAGADDYLRLLVGEILPKAEESLIGTPAWRGIVGYSLAGLFALYAAIYQTDIFSRVGSISGSLWFLGLKQYILTHEPKRPPERIYFSLGDKESKTRNPVLRSVRQDTEEIYNSYRSMGVDAVFQLNPGNHNHHAAERTAAGIAWLLSRRKNYGNHFGSDTND